MTRAERLHNLLKDIKKNEAKSLMNIWQEMFEVSDIFEIYERLIYVKKEIDYFESEIAELNLSNTTQLKDIVKILNFIVKFPALNASINNQAIMQDNTINIVFSSFDFYQSISEAQHIDLEIEENIPEKEFNIFKDSIDNIIEEINSSNISDNDKNIFLSIFKDINKAISLYKINGLNAFMEAIRNNLCKIQMLSENDKEDSNSERFKILTKRTIAKIYIWSKSYIKKKAVNSIELNAIKFLDDKVSKWAELPVSSDNDIEDADIIEE